MRAFPAAIAKLVAEPEGARKLGQYVLEHQLGSGGFAPVWSAREEYAGRAVRTVAIKLFSLESEAGEGAGSVEQVLEEARTLCRVEHPNIVRFYSVAIDAERQVAGFAMEHLEGTSLDGLLEEGKLSLPEVVHVGVAVASALAVVHRAGIVHRDVKPGNIIETATGYKLIDFGIAAGRPAARQASLGQDVQLADVPLAEQDTRQVSATLAVSVAAEPSTVVVELAAGTVGYIDPECLRYGRPANAASDLYSLGATLFELVTGKLPAATDDSRLRGEVMDGRVPAPSLLELEQGMDPDFAELVAQLLCPTRDKRPVSAEVVLGKLERLRHVLAGRDRPLPVEDVGPFRGLSRFEAADRAVYFGRSLEVAQALHVLKIRGFVALLGPSGSGKSSLASAGVLPAIEDGELGVWPTQWDALRMTPGILPATTLRSLVGGVVTLAASTSQAELLERLGRRAEAQGRGVILLIDQLEELATVSDAREREWVSELIALAAEQSVPGFRVVVTARRDLLDPLLELSALGQVLLKNSLLVQAMSSATWVEVLDQALSAYGYRCEDAALRDELASELHSTASAMPLVGFALGQLWQKRDRERKVVTRSALHALGGIAGALAQHAQATYESLAGAEATVRRTMLALTTARGTRTTRSHEELRVLADDSARVVQAFERAHLIVRVPDGFTLAHEVLITKWQLLRNWVTEVQEARSLAEELESDSTRHELDPEGVPGWSGRRLHAMADVLARGDVSIGSRAQAYFAVGRRGARRRRALWVGASAMLVGVLAAGAWAYLAAIEEERGKTVNALVLEKKSRHEAEQRTEEVQAAQQRIDELLRNVADSPTKDEVLDLQRLIRVGGPAAAASASRAALRASTVPRDAAAAPASAAAPVAATPPSIKVQQDW
jgi:eukaryotic-like serine/threonine-protein kinase